jgi:phytanoyl-CoA hydroxylase
MKLTNEQIAEFDKNGFLLLKDFADPALCDAILAKAQEHLSEQIEPIESEEEYQRTDSTKTTVRRLRQVYDREDIFKEWMTDKKIRPILEQLLGQHPCLLLAHHNSIMTKLPFKSSITTWHQDIRYWHYENDELLSVWLSLGDEYLENGLLEFIPGSHKMHFKPEQFDERSSFREDLETNQKIISTRVHYNLEKGDIILFHAKTLHYAHQNEMDKTKISFVYSLRSATNHPKKNTRSDFKEIKLI